MTAIVIGLHNSNGDPTWMAKLLWFSLVIVVVTALTTVIVAILWAVGKEVTEGVGYYWTKGRLHAEREDEIVKGLAREENLRVMREQIDPVTHECKRGHQHWTLQEVVLCDQKEEHPWEYQ